MFFLDGTEASKIICSCEYEPVWNIVGIVIDFIKIGIPIILIVLSMIDLAKAVIAGKEDEQKKATKVLGKRFLYAIGVFASVWLVTLVLDIASDAFKGQDDYNYNENSWKKCWAIIEHDACDSNTSKGACYLCGQDNASGMSGYYEWRNTAVTGCHKQASIKTRDECNKLNS